jgi:hypothetical protein
VGVPLLQTVCGNQFLAIAFTTANPSDPPSFPDVWTPPQNCEPSELASGKIVSLSELGYWQTRAYFPVPIAARTSIASHQQFRCHRSLDPAIAAADPCHAIAFGIGTALQNRETPEALVGQIFERDHGHLQKFLKRVGLSSV